LLRITCALSCNVNRLKEIQTSPSLRIFEQSPFSLSLVETLHEAASYFFRTTKQ
jgi:hypothetical protein